MYAYRHPHVERRRRTLPNRLVIVGFLLIIAGYAIWKESAAHAMGATLLCAGISAFCLGLFLRSRWPESRRRVQRLG